MQGRKEIEARLFYHISLDQLVPQDHLVRRLTEVLDLEWIRAATVPHYSRLGRPSLDPVVIAKLLVLGYLFNIPSERQLLREVQVNLAYRWYVGYDLDEAIPHHSDLSKARKRFGAAGFERLFGYILQRCQQAGLVGGQTVLIDSTVVKAHASLDSVVPVLRYRPPEYWQQLEQTAQGSSGHSGVVSNAPASASEAPSPPPVPASCGSPALVSQAPLSTAEADVEPSPEAAEASSASLGHQRPRAQRQCDRKYSTTDPQASLARRVGKETKMAYKAHVMADAHQGVITAVSVTAASVDDTAAVPSLLDAHRSRCGRPQQAVADRLYGSQDCLGYLQSRGIETVIRPRQGGNKHGGLSKQDFSYDARQDVYHCPGGQVLSRRRRQRKDGKAFYSASPGVCQACSLRGECVRSPSPQAVRQVTRYDRGYVERAEAACRSPHGRRLLHRRQTCMEGLFGQAKTWHGLDRARWRGQVKMRVQLLLTAAVLNLKKLLKVVRGSKSAAAEIRASSTSCLTDLFVRRLTVGRLHPASAAWAGHPGTSPRRL